MDTIPAADVLVAVADPNVMAVLAMADDLWWAADRYAQAVAAYEDVTDLGASAHLTTQQWEDRRRRCRRQVRLADEQLDPLNRRYEWLMQQIGDDDLYARVEEMVWRDRKAEYAHARQVHDREAGQR